MNRTLVILVVGLTPGMLGPHTPRLTALAQRGAARPLVTEIPAVTCTAQATMVTGLRPSGHGAVANGWYFRDLREIMFWRQPDNLVHGEKIWEAAKIRDRSFTCARMFWWYNMYSSADYSATPRPMYPADGRKIPDHYAEPPALHDELDAKLGRFPLFRFWGPLADITASDWIAKATLHVMETRDPTLTMTYLPHLDYDLQRIGPDLADPRIQTALGDVDALCGTLIDHADATGRRIVVVSEYGITPAVDAIHPNRALREAGLLRVRPEEFGRETLDAGASAAFAVCDHQLAHVYVRDPDATARVRALLEGLDGVEAVWGGEEKAARGLDHPRAGELVAMARADRWFSYYYWLDEARAPDFARTVDIHRKPGYDPVELFFDPALSAPKLRAGWRLGQRRVGIRNLLDVISPSATALVKGTHGRPVEDPAAGPVLISSEAGMLPDGPAPATAVKGVLLDHLFA